MLSRKHTDPHGVGWGGDGRNALGFAGEGYPPATSKEDE